VTALIDSADDLNSLLEDLDPAATLVERHLWLIDLLQWIRGTRRSTHLAVARVDTLLDTLDAQPRLTQRLQSWWACLLGEVDGSTLLSDYGFASRNAFLSELVQRLHYKLLPGTPETSDASELFALAMPSERDAQWLIALPEPTLRRLAALLSAPMPGPLSGGASGDASGHALAAGTPVTCWQNTLVEAITYCTSQIRATGFSADIRLRMSTPARDAIPFHSLAADFDAVRHAWLAGAGVEVAEQKFKAQLEACRQAAASVYTHLDAHGISMDLVFRLRQLRERVLRVRLLMDCLLNDPHHSHAARLLSQLAAVGQERRSIGALVASNTSLLAAKVAERSSETGEHYITRTRAEYRTMLGQAAGGGALTAITTALKFGVMALGLTAFWYGFWTGAAYALSFVVIQLLHFTLATKQPAMTAPAMAAKLKDLSDSQALELFVDEVTHLVRSQVAAVIGNVGVVFPVVVALSYLMQLALGKPMIDADKAQYVMDSLTLLGPSVLFAAFTGVLLFASSMVAGWVENWFVLHRLDSAMRYNPRITAVLGARRADRWAHFMRHQISGLAANISLGFMLGLAPAILLFFGVGLDVRHVTLSAGQLGAACASLGWDVVRSPALWWAVAALPMIAMLNLGVSFYLAFRVALRAHNVTGGNRTRVYQAIRKRVRQQPLSFFWPDRNLERGG